MLGNEWFNFGGDFNAFPTQILKTEIQFTIVNLPLDRSITVTAVNSRAVSKSRHPHPVTTKKQSAASEVHTLHPQVHTMITREGKTFKRNWTLLLLIYTLTALIYNLDNFNAHCCHTVTVPCNMQNILRAEWGFHNMEGLVVMSPLICLLSE